MFRDRVRDTRTHWDTRKASPNLAALGSTGFFGSGCPDYFRKKQAVVAKAVGHAFDYQTPRQHGWLGGRLLTEGALSGLSLRIPLDTDNDCQCACHARKQPSFG